MKLFPAWAKTYGELQNNKPIFLHNFQVPSMDIPLGHSLWISCMKEKNRRAIGVAIILLAPGSFLMVAYLSSLVLPW